MHFIYRVLLYSTFLAIIFPVHSQVSGTIYYLDGTSIEIENFEELSIELINNSRNLLSGKNKESHEYQRSLPLGRLHQINFIFDNKNSSDAFHYLLTIKGKKSISDDVKIVLKTWDWMEISSPESSQSVDTRVIFFYRQKRMKIERIVFNPAIKNLEH